MNVVIVITVVVVSICCIVTVKIFTKDSRHDLEIQVGRFRFSIKKHDRATLQCLLKGAINLAPF